MTITKKIGRACGKNFMVITVELREDHEELSGGFSVTADLYEPRDTRTAKNPTPVGLCTRKF